MSEPFNVELAARMPWLLAEPESIWVITGIYTRSGGTFADCLAMVLPFEHTAGARFFVLIHPSLHESLDSPDRLIAPNQITRARRLILVEGDDPRTAYYEDDQDFIDRAHEHR